MGSYWQRAAGWCDQWQDCSLPSTVDFAVLGGGLAGLTTAIRLRELHPGADIVVLEAERVGYGASGRNAGFLSPLAAPVWLLGADRDPDQAWAAARIHADVHDAAGWVADTLPDAELRGGTLRIDATGRLSDGGLREFACALEHVGLAHHLEESSAWPGHLTLAMRAYTVDPYRLVRGLAQHAVRIGVVIRERARVRTLNTAPAGARVQLDGGEQLTARSVIVCTNAYTATLDVGERLRALEVHSFLTATAPVDPFELVHDGDFTVELNRAGVFHRTHANRILFGGGDQLLAPAGDDYAVPASVTSRLAKQLRQSFPQLGAVASTVAWAGKFHATANGLPIIRRSRSNPAVILNVGYGGTGVALTLVCARLAAAVASENQFARADDQRFLSMIQGTRISVRDALRTGGRIARRFVQR